MTSDELLSDLEGTCNYTLQAIRRLRVAKRELQVLRENGFQYTPSRIRRAEEEVERLDRNLAKITDELVEMAMKVTGSHQNILPMPMRRHASRGD